MKRWIIATALVLTLAMSSHVYAWTISGTLRQPFDPNQTTWYQTACTDKGFFDGPPGDGQIFMQWNASHNGYHMAEDWNGKCGYSSDKYSPLYAIGDGFVIYVNNDASITTGGIGKSLTVRYTLPDGSQIDSIYEHVQDISVSIGMNVQNGDKIATIGDGNGQYSNAAHLHWEIHKNIGLSQRGLSYLNPLDIPTALKYTSSSLFVDDRAKADVHGLSSGAWTYFSVPSNAPSSTAYVEYGAGRYSLKRAVDNNLIYSQVWVQINGTWYYYPDITKVVFSPGNTYAVYGFVPNANLYVLIPGHKYQDDRAKIDMIRAVSVNSNFKAVKPDNFKLYSSNQSYDYRYMQFTYNNGNGNQTVYANQATLKSNPIIRYTTYYDLATASWTPWVAVDPNMLY